MCSRGGIYENNYKILIHTLNIFSKTEVYSDFLFNDEYYIDWGKEKINFIHISEILNLDSSWERKKILKEIQNKTRGKINDKKK